MISLNNRSTHVTQTLKRNKEWKYYKIAQQYSFHENEDSITEKENKNVCYTVMFAFISLQHSVSNLT